MVGCWLSAVVFLSGVAVDGRYLWLVVECLEVVECWLLIVACCCGRLFVLGRRLSLVAPGVGCCSWLSTAAVGDCVFLVVGCCFLEPGVDRCLRCRLCH